MPIPDMDSLHLPLLKLLEDESNHGIRDVIDHMASVFQITDEERKQLTPVGKKPILDTRVLWAVSQLRHAGLLINSQRGIFRITDRGLGVLKQKPARIDRRFLMQFPEFQQYVGMTSSGTRTETQSSGIASSEDLDIIDHKSSRVIVRNGVTYSKIKYRNERQLECLAIQNKHALFGNHVIYFDKKKAMHSNAKLAVIPDGLALTVPDIDDSRLWLIEYELAEHDPHGHVLPQISKFLHALRNESTKKSIKEMLYKLIMSDAISKKKIKSIFRSPDDEIHAFLELVLDKDIGVIIVIDRKTPEVQEVTEEYHPKILEFATFRNNDGEKIYLSDVLQATKSRKF